MLKLCAFQSLNTLQCWKQWFLCSRNNYHLRILLHFEIFYNFKTIIGRLTIRNGLRSYSHQFIFRHNLNYSTFLHRRPCEYFCCIFFSNSKLYLLLVIRRGKLMLKWPSTRFIFCSTRVLRLGIFYANWLENSLWNSIIWNTQTMIFLHLKLIKKYRH